MGRQAGSARSFVLASGARGLAEEASASAEPKRGEASTSEQERATDPDGQRPFILEPGTLDGDYPEQVAPADTHGERRGCEGENEGERSTPGSEVLDQRTSGGVVRTHPQRHSRPRQGDFNRVFRDMADIKIVEPPLLEYRHLARSSNVAREQVRSCDIGEEDTPARHRPRRWTTMQRESTSSPTSVLPPGPLHPLTAIPRDASFPPNANRHGETAAAAED